MGLVERVAEVVQVAGDRVVVVAEEVGGPARPVLQGLPDCQRTENFDMIRIFPWSLVPS